MECSENVSTMSKSVGELPCLIETQANLTEQHVMILSTKQNLPIETESSLQQLERTNHPMTVSFNGESIFFRSK